MRIGSLLFKKTKSYQAIANIQSRAPIFFLSHLDKLGLLPTTNNIPKDLDFTKNTYLVVSVDIRALSKAKLDFLISTLNSAKFKKVGLLKASILSVFSLKGRLQFNMGGLSGFDGSPLLVLACADPAQAPLIFQESLKSDFLDDNESKEWAALAQTFLPLFVSFSGYLFPFEFFKNRFEKLACAPRSLPICLMRQAFANISFSFGFSVSKLLGANTSMSKPILMTPDLAVSVLRGIFLSSIKLQLCQQ